MYRVALAQSRLGQLSPETLAKCTLRECTAGIKDYFFFLHDENEGKQKYYNRLLIKICDIYWETIPKVGKDKSELGAKTGFRVEVIEIEVMIDFCIKW